MKKLRKPDQDYDVWLHWDVTKRCNLDCEYCFGKITDPSVQVYSIDIERLMSTLDNSGKTFRISFTGGEPTMIPNFFEVVKAVTKNHYVSFNSNLITKNILRIAEVDPKKILHIHASFHFTELIQKTLMGRFISNFKFLQKNGFNIYNEAVAFPSVIDQLESIKQLLSDSGIKIGFGPFYGKFDGKIYPESYSEKELKMFNISSAELSSFFQEGNICNAGYNAAVVFSNGDVYPCHQIKRKIGNIYENINFDKNLVGCPSKKCGCPLNHYDNYLFEKALNIKGEPIPL